jgi:hypothetical protein
VSECILFAIDAAEVTTADLAVDFVEQWQDNQDAPTARIATFFVRLLQTWPEDGSKGHVLHEEFAHSRPLGPLLELVLESSEFDETRLRQLRAIAAHHQVKLFDPEGHVLYLIDGSEAGRTPPAPSIPAAGPTRCAISGLRFDGVYESRLTESWSYLAFSADDRVWWQSSKGRLSATVAMQSLFDADSFVCIGKYEPTDNSFTARLKAAYGSFKMSGELAEDGMLTITSEKTNGSKRFTSPYSFIPL